MKNPCVADLSSTSIIALFILMLSSNWITNSWQPQSTTGVAEQIQEEGASQARKAFSRPVPTGFQSGIASSVEEFVLETPYRVLMNTGHNNPFGVETVDDQSFAMIEEPSGNLFFTTNSDVMNMPVGAFFMRTVRNKLGGNPTHSTMIIIPESSIDFSKTDYDNTGP